MSIYPSHIPLTPSPTHTLLFSPFTHPSYTLLSSPQMSTLLPTHTHTAWSLQWKNLTSQTNPTLPHLSPTIKKATIEPTAVKAVESVRPQPCHSGEFPRTQKSECCMKNSELLHVYACEILLMESAMYVINDFAISSRPKNFDLVHQTVLSLEVYVGYRMRCMSEKLIE